MPPNIPENQIGKNCLKKNTDKNSQIQQNAKTFVTPLMPKPIHQKSVTYRTLKRHLPLLLTQTQMRKDFTESWLGLNKLPPTTSKRNIAKYNKIIKAINFLLKIVDEETSFRQKLKLDNLNKDL